MARGPTLSEQLEDWQRNVDDFNLARAAEQQALGRDHWLVSGRIDGIREALEVMRSGVSRHEAERQLEERISVLMNQP